MTPHDTPVPGTAEAATPEPRTDPTAPSVKPVQNGDYKTGHWQHGEGCDGAEHIGESCPEHMNPRPVIRPTPETEAGETLLRLLAGFAGWYRPEILAIEAEARALGRAERDATTCDGHDCSPGCPAAERDAEPASSGREAAPPSKDASTNRVSTTDAPGPEPQPLDVEGIQADERRRIVRALTEWLLGEGETFRTLIYGPLDMDYSTAYREGWMSVTNGVNDRVQRALAARFLLPPLEPDWPEGRAMRKALEDIVSQFNRDNIRPGTAAFLMHDIAQKALAADTDVPVQEPSLDAIREALDWHFTEQHQQRFPNGLRDCWPHVQSRLAEMTGPVARPMSEIGMERHHFTPTSWDDSECAICQGTRSDHVAPRIGATPSDAGEEGTPG